MKTMTKVLTAAAVFVVALSLAAPVEATCGAPVTIQGSAAGEGTSYVGIQPFFDFPPYYAYPSYPPVVSGYGDPPPALTPNARATFWMLGAGDPAPGVGNDNGAYNVIGSGIYGYSGVAGSYGYHVGATININWENGLTDNCLEGAGDCLCMLLTDDFNNQGYFAIAGAAADANLNTTLNQSGTTSPGGGHNAPLVLVPIPGPTIVNTTRDAVTNDLTVDVNVNLAPSAGDYSKDGCNCAPIGYKILQSSVPFGDMPPQDRDISQWSEPTLADGVTPQGPNGSPVGMGISINTDCTGSTDEVYLTTALLFDSGFGTTQVSGSSTRMECDPNLAKPGPRARPDRGGKERPKARRR